MCVTLCMSVLATYALAYIIIHLTIDGEIHSQTLDTMQKVGVCMIIWILGDTNVISWTQL
jgi:hypothetical protein